MLLGCAKLTQVLFLIATSGSLIFVDYFVATSPRKVINIYITLLAEDFRLQHNRTEVMQSISSFPKSLALCRT